MNNPEIQISHVITEMQDELDRLRSENAALTEKLKEDPNVHWHRMKNAESQVDDLHAELNRVREVAHHEIDQWESRFNSLLKLLADAGLVVHENAKIEITDKNPAFGMIDSLAFQVREKNAEIASLTAERDGAREAAAAVRLKLAELQRPFTVTVEIPELDYDMCHYKCPLMSDQNGCEANLQTTDDDGCQYPGPGCPRYQKPEAKDSNG